MGEGQSDQMSADHNDGDGDSWAAAPASSAAAATRTPIVGTTIEDDEPGAAGTGGGSSARTERGGNDELRRYSPSEGTSPPLPKSNLDYGKKEYWEKRFSEESEFEWLVSYEVLARQIADNYVQKGDKILVVGCGNSSFSSDLYDAGYRDVTSIDYSETVIRAMEDRNAGKRPEMKWIVMDMMDMSSLPDASFDVVIDKAAMDAIMTNEGDVWNPDQSVIDSARKMCRHISRVLRGGGYHLHISFSQPHFRKKYLLGLHRGETGEGDGFDSVDEGEEVAPRRTDGGNDCGEAPAEEYSEEFGWHLKVDTIAGDSSDGCFHHFLYIMKKLV